jgi:hypothetical protein
MRLKVPAVRFAALLTGILAVISAGVPPAVAQLVIHLQPSTLSDFEHYAARIESSLAARQEGKKLFLQIDESAADRDRTLAGEFLVQAETSTPVEIPGGLIHDWRGDVFFPRTGVERVVDLLEDFNAHKTIYPQVTESAALHRKGNDVTGYWRLQQKAVIPIVFHVEQQAHYEEVSPGKWMGRCYARHIAEINSTLFGRGREYPNDEGHGYLWRLYSYWSLESRNGGVLAECRTLSLSRDIPAGLAWAVAPLVRKMPEDSLASTLKATRDAIAKGGAPAR